MSKAFTRDDDDASFAVPPPATVALPDGPLRLTAAGAARLEASDDARLRALLARAEILPRVGSSPERAALGVTVHVRRAGEDEERTYRLVTPEEYSLLGEGCSVVSPLGQALLGAEVGDERTVRAPRGKEELEIVSLEGDGHDA